ncbi:ABC-2 type transport system permease protein [Dethiosulfatibacter aminovorans DSM 17477]|uniref:Transport permease protein n=1 Tax=Dethiosulfatibacter aminovorans DSM 17477 TaxID=1121476 RepID=A0A1M6GM05_9FIRM|nr:ABC transporter permease [Dethiosulfatibacter aminovorans]SHJ10951.1 ABC-2 type transport system permease protein [Dethiosulfatibacter aminovorans DSM 17477]
MNKFHPHFFSFKRLVTITKKEFIHIRRDKPSLVISFMLPIMMLMLFGFAVNTDVNNIDLAVYDASRTSLSRELIGSFSNSYYFTHYALVDSEVDLERLINKGEIKVGLIIPDDYAIKLKRKEPAQVQVLVDGSDPSIARTAASYSLSITAHHSTEYQVREIKRLGQDASIGSVSVSPMFLYNPTLESARFNIPGVVGLILQNITIVLTALAMVRERELGTMEQLIMTPVTSFELIVGKIIPYILIGIYDFIVVITLSYWVFGVSVAGSMFELTMLGLIFLIGALAMGMLISTFARNQAQAIQVTLAFILPSVLLSGFMFPRESMPQVIQFISNLLPITHFLIVLRGIIVKGVGLTELADATIAMLSLIGLIIFVTTIKFTKKLD